MAQDVTCMFRHMVSREMFVVDHTLLRSRNECNDEILTVENVLSKLPVGDNENAETEVIVNDAKIGCVNFMVVVVVVVDDIVEK